MTRETGRDEGSKESHQRSRSASTEKKRNDNNVIQPLLTDLYQITMAYAYWKCDKRESYATFDVFFRRNPFNGEFTVFAGLEEVLRFLENFKFSEDDIEYLKHALPDTTDAAFFEYLRNLTTKDVVVYAQPEGTVAFPKVPLLRIEGPLPICQLLETTILNLINFASLMTTNAARYRIAAGDIQLLEFGLRRAQGPDGGLSASKYAYVGGFDATSNVLAGKLYGIPVKGTHAHSFVMSYSSTEDLKDQRIQTLQDKTKTGSNVVVAGEQFIHKCLMYQERMADIFKVIRSEANQGELAAFIAYAVSFPDSFLALIDTYDVVRSGALNFSAVAMALFDLGYKPIGVRIDSGDLAYLSIEVHKLFCQVAKEFNVPSFKDLTIVASNDINEDTIIALKEQGHKINCYGIGTHLVTCQRQPALGCVYKLVEVDNRPTIKLSLEVAKVTIPGRKVVYRLYGEGQQALLDLLQMETEAAPEAGVRVLCRHPFLESKRAYVTPAKVELLLKLVFERGHRVSCGQRDLQSVRKVVKESLNSIRSDIKRYLNPTPYKVSVSEKLYEHMHKLWLDNSPVGELK